MARTQQTFENAQKVPIYISVEPWPECFELEPGDKLTLMWDAAGEGDAVEVQFINECELVLWPNIGTGEIVILFNGESAEGRSWMFKHQ